MKIFGDHITKDFLIKNEPSFSGTAYQPDGLKTWAWEFIICFGERQLDDPVNVIMTSPEIKCFINQISAIRDMQKTIPRVVANLDKHVGGIPNSKFFQNVNEKEEARVEFLDTED